MRIKTQFLVCLSVFTIILVIIAVSVASTEQQVAYLSRQQDISSNIERGASSLNSIAIDYFLYQEDLQLSRWETTVSSLSSDLGNIRPSSVDQQALVDSVASDLQGLRSQFDDVVSYLRNAPRNVSVRIDPAFQFRWSSMALLGLNFAFDSSQLSQSINDQVRQLNTANILLILSMVGTFGALLATIYFIIFRKTLKSVTKLQRGIDTIGKGNLDYRVEIGEENEITQLSDAFNRMTSSLKTVTASKADLEGEIAERKKAEKALEDAQSKLQEYAKSLEELVEERTRQLRDSERLAGIGQTAGMVGHDIRNPLQAITGDVYLLKSDLASLPESEERGSMQESLDGIEQNVAYVNKIVQDLQDYARPLKPDSRETDIEALCEEVLFKNGVPGNIETSCKVEGRAKKIVSDPDLLKRVLCNLVSNAIQAMPKGGKLGVNALRDGEDVVITVSDTGVGIPEEARAKLFTPLFTTKSKGQGFGLAVVKRITEALGGTVNVESEIGKGTKFSLCLPPEAKL